MINRDATMAALRSAMPTWRRQWPIRSLGIFGSVARGDADENSDLDVLVEFERPVSLSAFLALEETLRQVAGMPVDLVSREALKPFICERVMNELVPL